MTIECSLDILRRGLAVLRGVENERRRILPPPEHEDAELLRDIREIVGLADRIDDELSMEFFPGDTKETYIRDASLSTTFDESDVSFLRALLLDRGAGTPYREGTLQPDDAAAIQELTDLISRYIAGEFIPPPSYFGITSPEA